MSTEYPKIYGPFKRHTEGPDRNKLKIGEWQRPEFDALAGLDWVWTEKVDGTNIRIIWDGYRVEFGGRTNNAQIPATLLKALDAMFPETLMEQTFGAKPVVLYGEGYGAKIQKVGANYRPDQSFVLFDVKVGDWWLTFDNVAGIAAALGIEAVPVVSVGPVWMAIHQVEAGYVSAWGEFPAEGFVGRPPHGLLGRDGDRLLMKIKAVDFATAVTA